MPVHNQTNQSFNHSNMDDLIGNPPGLLLRSGITMIALVTAIILIMSWFISYPDKITASGILTTTHPPIEILAKDGGKIESIYVKEGDTLTKGDPILYIKNDASLEEVKVLSIVIKAFNEMNDVRDYLSIEIPKLEHLGMMQADYLSMMLKLNEFKILLRQSGVFEQINTLHTEKQKIEHLNTSMYKEKNIMAEEMALYEKDFQRQKSLNESGVISDMELEKNKMSWLQNQRQYEGAESGIIQNKIRMSQLDLQSLQLKEERASMVQGYLSELNGLITSLSADQTIWKNKYILDAEVDGAVAFVNELYLNKELTANEVVAYIINGGDGEYLVKANTLTDAMGKIHAGDRLLLKLQAFPYKEYGMLSSQVSHISTLPQQDKNGDTYYQITGLMPDVLKTTYGDTIPYKPNMPAIVEIITEDKSVLDRVFNQFRSLLDNNRKHTKEKNNINHQIKK